MSLRTVLKQHTQGGRVTPAPGPPGTGECVFEEHHLDFALPEDDEDEDRDPDVRIAMQEILTIERNRRAKRGLQQTSENR